MNTGEIFFQTVTIEVNVTIEEICESFLAIKSAAIGYDKMHPKILRIILD